MDKINLIVFLKNTNLISAVSAKIIADQFENKKISKNKLHLSAGKICDEYFFLETGYMRAFAQNTEGNEVTTGFYAAGQIVFEVSSFFNRTKSKENIQALTDCHGWFITFKQLNLLFHEMPEFREFGRSVLVQGFAELKSRMLATITETAEARYAFLLHANPEIFQQTSLKNIASYLGITDTSLSRIRKDIFKKL